jgi:hypothetical protein
LLQYFPFFGHSIDLDQVQQPYLQGFTAVILRNGPATSRPPGDFRQVYRNRYYAVWRHDPRPTVLEHLPLSAIDRATAVPRCQDVRALAGRAGPGDTLLAASRPPVAELDYTAKPPAGWLPAATPATVVPQRPGRVQGRVRVAGGRYRVWVRGSSGRKLHISIDGRPQPAAVGVNTPEQWLGAGEVLLSPGTHEITLLRPGGGPAPGDGFAGELGPVELEPVAAPTLMRVAPAKAASTLCGHAWDWIERVRG